jgi:hypothetical protein
MSPGMKLLAFSDSSFASMFSAMATVFPSGCLRIDIRTAGTPRGLHPPGWHSFSRAHRRCFWWVSSTVATSVSGTLRPPPTSSSRPRISAIERNFPSVFPTTSCSVEPMRPAATS